MRIARTALFLILAASAATAQTLSMGNAITAPNGSDYAIASIRTAIDLTHPANGNGTITAVRFYWTAGCTNAVSIRFYRRRGPDLLGIGARGPYNTIAGDNTITLASPMPVKQGDLIGVTRVANCGALGATVGIVTAGSLVYGTDIGGGTSFAAGTRRGEVVAIGGTGTGQDRLVGVLPVVGYTSGGFGSQWRTALQVANCMNSNTKATLVIRKQGVPGSETDTSIPQPVNANLAIDMSDTLPYYQFTGLGSVDIFVPFGMSPPAFVTRIYNDGGSAGTSGFSEGVIDPNGTYELGAPVLAMGSTGVLIAPSDPAHHRFNIGVRSLYSGATLNVTLKRMNGAVVTTVTKSYWPNTLEQVPAESFLGGATLYGNDMIVISVSDGSAIIYGSANDNITNDPSVQFATVMWWLL